MTMTKKGENLVIRFFFTTPLLIWWQSKSKSKVRIEMVCRPIDRLFGPYSVEKW